MRVGSGIWRMTATKHASMRGELVNAPVVQYKGAKNVKIVQQIINNARLPTSKITSLRCTFSDSSPLWVVQNYFCLNDSFFFFWSFIIILHSIFTHQGGRRYELRFDNKYDITNTENQFQFSNYNILSKPQKNYIRLCTFIRYPTKNWKVSNLAIVLKNM